MLRSRIVKPDFFKHGALYDAERASGLPLRLAFQGLWCVTDRAGRFVWKPRELKLDVLPYDPVDFSEILDALETYGFVQSYTVDGKRYGYIPSFTKHQTFHHRESESKLPPPPDNNEASPVQEQVEPSASLGLARVEPRPSPTVSVSVSVSDSVSVADEEPAAPQSRVLSLEAETYRRTYPRVADALLPDESGDPLAELCRRLSNLSVNPVSYVAELNAALDGMHGPIVAPKYLRLGVTDWLSNLPPPNLRTFRNYLYGAVPRGGMSPTGEPESATQATKRKLLEGIPKELLA